MQAIIETKALSKQYQRGSEVVHALNVVNLQVKQGEFISIVGPSGSGKSTLMNLLGCLDTATTGSYRLGGQEIVGMHEKQLAKIRQSKIGFVFQQFLLLPTLTVLENVELPLLFTGKGGSRAKELLEVVGLSHRERHLPRQLSGGEMQRVAIARALINDPQVLLADEPTGNLDSQNSAKVIKLFNELNDRGLTIIMVTHNNELADVADRVITITDGQISERQGKRVG